MTVLPVVERELRVLARSRRLYWGRFATAQIAVALVAWCWFALRGGGGSPVSKQIFVTLSVLFFCYCLFAGSYLTADAISEEKREGTLGLLFLTDLRGYDVAFGKLAANSLQAIYNLIAIFPVMTIPLLLGGLTGNEILRVALVLQDTLIFSLTAGLLVSTVSRHDRKAQAGAFALVLFITLGIPGLRAFVNHFFPLARIEMVECVSPAFALQNAFEQNFAAHPGRFWVSVTAIHFLSWAAFISTALLVPRIWQDRPDAKSHGGWRAAFRRWKHGSTEVRRRYREALLGQNAYYWLSGRDRLKPYYVLAFLAACGAFWGVIWFYNPRDILEQEAFFATACLLHTLLKVWLASEAGRQFFEDRKSSALELTLSTPMTVKEILEGQFLALFRQFGPAFGIVLLFDVLGVVMAARIRLGADTEWLLTWAAIIILFLVDAATLAALGMWLGLTAKRYSRAVARSLFFVLVLPWLIFFGLVSYMAVARLTTLNSLSFIIGMYFLISLLTDLVLFFNASEKLARTFRETATLRFDSAR